MKSSSKVTLHQPVSAKGRAFGALEPLEALEALVALEALEALEAPEVLVRTESFGKSWTRRQKL